MTQWRALPHFDFGSGEYGDLFARASATAFQHPIWLTAVYRHLMDGRDVAPLIVVGRDRDTRGLSAVLPLVRRQTSNGAIVEYAGRQVTDYACPIVDPGMVLELAGAYIRRSSMSEALGTFDRVQVEPVRNVDVALWSDLLRVTPAAMDLGRHSVQPGPSFQEWRRRNLSPGRREQLDRKRRRLADRGEVKCRVLPLHEVAGAVSWARQVRRGRFRDDPLQGGPGLRFYGEVAETGAASGFARTYELSCGGQPVAVCVGVVDGDRFCYLLLGCDYETYGEYSPGMLVLELAMENWFSGGGSVFDLTIGDESYKRAWRCERSPMFTLSLNRAHS